MTFEWPLLSGVSCTRVFAVYRADSCNWICNGLNLQYRKAVLGKRKAKEEYNVKNIVQHCDYAHHALNCNGHYGTLGNNCNNERLAECVCGGNLEDALSTTTWMPTVAPTITEKPTSKPTTVDARKVDEFKTVIVAKNRGYGWHALRVHAAASAYNPAIGRNTWTFEWPLISGWKCARVFAVYHNGCSTICGGLGMSYASES